MDLSFPTHVNWKCVALTLTGFAIYVVSTLVIPKYGWKGVAVASAVTAVLSIAAVCLYHVRWYRCKVPLRGAWVGIVLFALLMASIPFMAKGMDAAVSQFPRQASWRKHQMMQATRYALVPFLLGIVLYVLMNRYDWSYVCLVKMAPTAISAPTAYMKSPDYRAKLKGHLPRFALWSGIFYALLIGGSLGVSGLIRFRTPRRA